MPSTQFQEVKTEQGTVRIPMTATQTLTARALSSGKPFNVQRKVHHSARPLVFERVDQRPLLSPTMGLYRLRAETLRFFNYAEGDSIELGTVIGGAPVTRKSDGADTSLTDARFTPHDADLAILAISMGQRNICAQYSEADINAAIAGSGGGALNNDTLDMLRGNTPLCDPGSIIVAPQLQSPSNLQNAIESFVKPFLKISLEWQGSSRVYSGMGHHFTHAMGKSYLESQGVAQLANAFNIPEGYIWNSQAEKQDTEMVVYCETQRPLEVVIQRPAFPLLGAVDIAGVPLNPFPERFIFWMLIYLHVDSFNQVSSNA